MPPVVFHVLSDAGEDARYRYACQLAEQAYDQNAKCFIRVNSTSEAQRVDELLWTFNDRAFIPHEVANENSPSDPRIAVLIGTAPAPQTYRALLINLGGDLPSEIQQCDRIAEVVDADAERKRLARERYKLYREQGCALETKNL